MIPFLFVWLIACSVAFFTLLLTNWRPRIMHPLLIIVLAAACARLVPLFLFDEPPGMYAGDIANYKLVADTLQNRGDVYELRGYLYPHPYLPLQMYLLALADTITGFLGLTFFTLVRLPNVAADLGTAVLIYWATMRLRKDSDLAVTAGLAYAVCPLPIYVAVYHGQFDVIPAFFALLAWYLFRFGNTPFQKIVLSAAVLGIGLLAQGWPPGKLPVFLF